MDNATHTLIGLLIAETAVQLRKDEPTRPNQFRLAAGFVSMLANNIPDFDALYTWITPKPLGSLLHHRGHTHTLLLAVPLALLSVLPFLWWARRRGWALSTLDRRWLYGLGFGGLASGQCAFLANLFPTRYRFSGIALSRELSGLLIAGPTPFIASALVAAANGASTYVAAYLMVCCAITILAVLAIQSRSYERGAE